MARPKLKKGFRRIVVDDVAYQWRVDDDHAGDLNVILDSESSARSARLTVLLWKWGTFTSMDGDAFRGPCEVSVTPGIVRKVIIRALSCGWEPEGTIQDGIHLELCIENGEITDTPYPTYTRS